MGTWDLGPFDNDSAADFCGSLDRAGEAERAGLLRAALDAAATAEGYLDGDEGAPAVAAAALVAAQLTGGAGSGSAYGPKEPLPELPGDLRPLAVRALDRVTGGDSELAALWDDAGHGEMWRRDLGRLRAVLTAP
ncbi:DUF4259 domain-containing protein [Kitasatospora sp. NPDC048540]|uniref:DUF4259 domain-containing protein n=1 Tax=Kitasatospora sp. NPDC048540 TaxID=3155634 RepID=UPI0033F306AA